MCMEEDTRVREEIAVRMLKETLIPSAQIARWTGLSRERVHALALQTKRLEGSLSKNLCSDESARVLAGELEGAAARLE